MLSRGSGVWGVDFDKSDPGEEGGIESQRWRRGEGRKESKSTRRFEVNFLVFLRAANTGEGMRTSC